jgi:23S rRNA (uracil1939-C5)-methyltransferase/tRNA (uracil-5-)-methyltransferase
VENKQPRNFVSTPFSYHEEVDVEILDITNLGFGVGRVNNWVVMVPYVCLDEIVRVRIYKNLKKYSLGDLVGVIRPSLDREQCVCELFGTCGGCQYQHMKYEKQLELKRHQIASLIQRLAGIDSSVAECIGCDMRYGYRSKITPHFQKNVPPIGFLKNGTRQIVDVRKCPIATVNINDALPTVCESILARKNSLKRGGTLLIRDANEGIITDPRGMATQKIGPYNFSFCAGEFFQNNPYLLYELATFVAQASTGPKYLIDAYCGVGVFGIIAAKNFEEVIGVEISETAIAFAQRNALQNAAGVNLKFICGSAERIFKDISFAGEDTSIIIDPPRAGCTFNFLSQLLTFAPAKIVYISCSPDTQARDLKVLSQKYSVLKIQPFDMFPQTRHIESVVVLEKTKGTLPSFPLSESPTQ